MPTGSGRRLDTEYIQQRIASYMDTLLHGDYSWYELSGVEHLLGSAVSADR